MTNPNSNPLTQFARLVAKMAFLLGAASAGAAPNLVANGGFETGNFTGWTQNGNVAYDFVAADSPRTGAKSAFFGASCAQAPVQGCQPTGGISQSLATQDGHIYAFEFYLQDMGSGSGTYLAQLLADGVSLVTQNVGLNNQGYVRFAGEFVGTGDDTLLSFLFTHDSTWWSLDDVAVTDTGRTVGPNQTPEPGTLLLVGMALGAAGLLRRRRPARPC